MIREIEQYHGLALVRLVRAFPGDLVLGRCKAAGGSAYLINETVGLLVKYSSKRMPPWNFTFTPDHLSDLRALGLASKDVVVALVCRQDGIVGLSMDDVKAVIDLDAFRQVGISVTRRRREL